MLIFSVNIGMKVVIFTSSAQGTHLNSHDIEKFKIAGRSNVKNTTFYRYLGPYQIASWLRQNDVAVQVVDFVTYWNDTQIKKIVDKFVTKECKLVCFSPFVFPFGASQNLIKCVRNKWNLLAKICRQKKVPTLLGGPSAYDPFIDKKYLDHVWKTYGEDYVLSLVKDTTKRFDIKNDVMKFANNDFIFPGESLPLEWSRGCVFKCKYCRYHNIGKNKHDHLKDPKKILATLEYNAEMFGTTNWTVTDDTLNAARETVKGLHKTLKDKNYNFAGYIRADLMHRWSEQIHSLPEIGFVSAFMGLESLNPDVLQLVGKGWGGKNYKTKLKKTADNWGDAMVISAGMIAGIPPEKQQDWEDSNQWLIDNTKFNPFWSCLHLHKKPELRVSEFELNAEKYGIKFDNLGSWRWNGATQENTNKWVKNITKINSTLERNKPAGHYAFGFFNMGFDWKTIKGNTKNTLNFLIQRDNTLESKLNDYYDRLMAY